MPGPTDKLLRDLAVHVIEEANIADFRAALTAFFQGKGEERFVDMFYVGTFSVVIVYVKA